MKENNIYLMDCIEGMKLLKEKSVSMILADLPYGVTARNEWDSIIPFDLLWEQYERIIKDNGAIVLTAKPPFDKQLAMSNIKLFKYEWIWEKNKATGHLNAKKMPMQAHENILVFYKKTPTYNPQMTEGHKPMNAAMSNGASLNYGKGKRVPNQAGTTQRYPRSVLKFPIVNQDSSERFHPTQKPTELFQYLIRTYTNEGDLVLDNCMGSGTTAISCIRENRRFIGFELNEDYHKNSLERINSELSKKDFKN